MKILTFQDYRVLNDVRENGEFISKINREWIEEKAGCVAVDKLTELLNSKAGTQVKSPVFGINQISLNVDMINDLREIPKFIAACPGMLDAITGVSLMNSTNVLLTLDVPEEYVIKYSQDKLNDLVGVFSTREDNFDSMNIENVLNVGNRDIGCCIIPSIKKEWIVDVHKILINPDTIEAILFKTDIELSKFELVVAYAPNEDLLGVMEVTDKFKGKHFEPMKVLNEYDTYTGWEFCEEFDQQLFEQFLVKTTGLSKKVLKKYSIKVDTENVFKSIMEIMDRIARGELL